MPSSSEVPAAKALALIRHPDGDRILVGNSDPDPRHPPFQRLLGGRIQFGERAATTVERELMEELGLKVRAGDFVTTLEVFFSYQGVSRHEITVVYEAAFDEPAMYERQEFVGVESPPHHAVWRSLSTPPPGVLLAPEGVVPLLQRRDSSPSGGQPNRSAAPTSSRRHLD